MKTRKHLRHIFAQSLFGGSLVKNFLSACIFSLLISHTDFSQAAITFRSASSNSVTTAGTSTITHIGAGTSAGITGCGNVNPSIPAGNVGDLLIALVATKEIHGGNAVAMAGWNTYYSASNAGGDDESELQTYIFWRIATGGDPNTITQSGTACNAFGGQISRFRGVDTANPFQTVNPGVVYQNSDNIDTGTITTTSATAMLLVAGFISDDGAVTQPGTWNQSFDFAYGDTGAEPDFTITLNYQLQTTAGNKSISNWAITTGTDENLGAIFALTPATGGLTINVPAGTTTDDVMVAAIAYRENTGITITPPSGWTSQSRVIQGGGIPNVQEIFTRVATGAEPASYTWSFSAAITGAAGGIVTYSGVDTANIVDVVGGNATPSGTSHTANSVTATVTNTMVVSAHSFASSETWTPPGGMNERVDIASLATPNGGGIALEINDVVQAATGATGNKTATVGGNADTGVAHQLALRPLVYQMHVVLPGETFTDGVGISGSASDQTVNVAFSLVEIVITDASNNIVTTYNGAKTINYAGPNGSPGYTTAVNFTNGRSTTTLTTTLDTVETTTITATDAGDVTINGIASSSFNVIAATGGSCSFSSGLASGFPGEYFNNMTLTDPPADTRIDGPVDFDWVNGAPGVVGIGADNFSVRWEGKLRVTTSGNYRFRTESDDGVRLYVNGILEIDNWTDHAQTLDHTGDISLTAGQIYDIRLEFYENGGQAEIRLHWGTGPIGGANGSFTFSAIPAGPSPVFGEGLYYCAAITPIAEWRMDESTWNGTAGEVIDETGTYNGTAVNGTQTDDTNRAVPGTPGTCGYGTFDDAGGSNGDYIEIPGFPDQNTDFTITAWINTQDNTRQGQRIFSDDENNTGGYALSVGDGGTGTLRFYSRNVTNVILDTGNVITNNTWYFIAGVADITNSERTLYIYNTSGTLVGTATDTFTGTWGTDAGVASIGGETNSGETDNRFFGNLDEVRFYDNALSQSDIEIIMNETHDCQVSQPIILSTIANSTIGGQGIDQDEAVEYDPVTDTGTLFLDDATFDGNENLDAIHALNDGSGNLVISTAGGAGIGGNNFNDGDLIEVTPSGTPGIYDYVGIYFAESNFGGGADIDAVYVRDNSNIILSVDNNETLPQCGGGTLNLDEADLVEWDVNNTCATLVFDFTPVLSGCADNIVGVHFLDDDENQILIATEGNCTIGGTDYLDGDVILYDRNTASASLYLDEGLFGADEDINALTLPAVVVAPLVYHYAISHSGSGVTCDASIITITAHDSGDIPVNVPGGTVLTISAVDAADGVTFAGQFANAVGGGSFSGTGNPVTYTWPSGTEENSFTIELRQLTPLTININADDGSATDKQDNLDPEDQDIVFSDAAFRITNNPAAIPVPATNITTKISGKSSNSTGFGQQTLYLQAIRTDDESGSCVGVFQSQTATIQMAGECNNPTACAGTAVTVEDNTSTFVPIGINNNAMVPPAGNYQDVTLNFNANSAAPLIFNYLDAGRITLHARYDIDPSGATEYMFGASNNAFIVRPFAFSIESGDGNFTATDANGTAFRKAGENFDVTVQAVVWQSADDADNNGVPDTSVDLTNNAVTPNFGNETAAPTIDITRVLALPTGGSTGTLTGGASVSGFGSVNPGETTATLAFSEVGIIDLTGTHTNYLTSGSNITGTREDIGRFYPARFQVTGNSPTFADACSAGINPFTYMGQTFFYNTEPQLTITALNTAGNPTNNYGDTSPASPGGVERFWKLSSTLPRNYDDTTGHGPANFIGLSSASVALSGDLDFTDGAGTLTLANDIPGLDRDSFLYTRTTEEAPFNTDVDLTFNGTGFTDTDGVCYDDAGGLSCNTNDGDTADPYVINSVGNTEQRFGRLVIGSAAGSELLPVIVPFSTEYFTSTGFETNTDDQCMVLGEADISLTSTVEGPVAGGPVDVSDDVDCADGDTTITMGAFTDGEAGLTFTAPGEKCIGHVDINLDLGAISLTIGAIDYPNLNFLKYDWNAIDEGGDGNVNDDNPAGRADFGVFEGPNELIYFREPW